MTRLAIGSLAVGLALAMAPRACSGADPASGGQAERLRKLIGQYTTAHDDKQYADGVNLAMQALPLAEEVYGPEDPNVAQILNDVGVFHRSQDHHAEAIAAHERALAIREAAPRPDPSAIAQSLDNLIVSHMALGQEAQALDYFEQLIPIVERNYPPGHPFWVEIVESYAVVLHRVGRHEEAKAQEARIKGFLALKRTMEEASPEPPSP